MGCKASFCSQWLAIAKIDKIAKMDKKTTQQSARTRLIPYRHELWGVPKARLIAKNGAKPPSRIFLADGLRHGLSDGFNWN